jgi:DNA-binding MarR family transcriptional regulator
MDIVNFSKFEKTRVARAVQRLISAGLIVTQKDPGDGRRVLLWLTESGAKLHDAMVPHAMRRNEILSKTLTAEERHQLDGLLGKLYDQLPAVEQVSEAGFSQE